MEEVVLWDWYNLRVLSSSEKMRSCSVTDQFPFPTFPSTKNFV